MELDGGPVSFLLIKEIYQRQRWGTLECVEAWNQFTDERRQG